MGSFFGKLQYGTPQGAYSIEHLGFFFIIAMIILALVLGLKNKNKSDKKKSINMVCIFNKLF